MRPRAALASRRSCYHHLDQHRGGRAPGQRGCLHGPTEPEWICLAIEQLLARPDVSSVPCKLPATPQIERIRSLCRLVRELDGKHTRSRAPFACALSVAFGRSKAATRGPPFPGITAAAANKSTSDRGRARVAWHHGSLAAVYEGATERGGQQLRSGSASGTPRRVSTDT